MKTKGECANGSVRSARGAEQLALDYARERWQAFIAVAGNEGDIAVTPSAWDEASRRILLVKKEHDGR